MPRSILRRARLAIIAAILVLVALVLGARTLLGPKVKAVQITRGELVQTVVSTGRMITPARVEVGTVMLGTVISIDRREGERVASGDVMARLKDDEQRAALEQARGTLAEAEARLVQLERLSAPSSEQAVRQAQANLDYAEEEYKRVKRLFERGFFSQAKLEEAARNLDVARAARESAALQATSNRPKGSDFTLAVARRDQARAALEVARAKLDNTVIRAPAPGVVLKRYAEPGDVVAQGKKLFDLSVAGETQIVLNVDEKNIGLLALGQRAEVVADAYPGRTFAARIFYIAPGVDAQRGTVEVKLVVPEPPAFLRPDMTVSAEIVAAKRDNAVMVASESIRDAASAAPWALVVRDGRAVRQAVKLGIRGAGQTEILEGAAPGEALVLPEAATVREGQRVRPDLSVAERQPAPKGPDIFK